MSSKDWTEKSERKVIIREEYSWTHSSGLVVIHQDILDDRTYYTVSVKNTAGRFVNVTSEDTLKRAMIVAETKVPGLLEKFKSRDMMARRVVARIPQG